MSSEEIQQQLTEISSQLINLTPEQEKVLGAKIVDIEGLLNQIKGLLNQIFHEAG